MSKPRAVKEILPEVVLGLRPPRERALEKLQIAWREVAGAKEAGQSRVKQLKRGILLIEVDSAPMMHHLSGKDKEGLIKGLRERVERVYIKDIRTCLTRE